MEIKILIIASNAINFDKFAHKFDHWGFSNISCISFKFKDEHGELLVLVGIRVLIYALIDMLIVDVDSV